MLHAMLLSQLVNSRGVLSLQHVNKKDPAVLQHGGLSGGATSADSKKIYPIDVASATSDSEMYVLVVEIVRYHFCLFVMCV